RDRCRRRSRAPPDPRGPDAPPARSSAMAILSRTCRRAKPRARRPPGVLGFPPVRRECNSAPFARNVRLVNQRIRTVLRRRGIARGETLPACTRPPRPLVVSLYRGCRHFVRGTDMDRRDLNRIIDHVAAAIDTAPEGTGPFFHLKLAKVFPDDVYAKMMEEMPVAADYRHMSGRTKSTRTMNGGGTRVKIDLFPEYIRHLPPQKRQLWNAIGKALCAPAVRDAFMRRLAPGLERRYGPKYTSVGMYPIPILTRDVPGYRIGIHPDTHWKGMTIQLYLPRDDSIDHVGTVFHARNADKMFTRAAQMKFSPNSGYAFAVDKNTWHSVDLVGPEVTTRDSILLTYFVDKTPLQVMRNRGKRVGNFILNEIRSIARQ